VTCLEDTLKTVLVPRRAVQAPQRNPQEAHSLQAWIRPPPALTNANDTAATRLHVCGLKPRHEECRHNVRVIVPTRTGSVRGVSAASTGAPTVIFAVSDCQNSMIEQWIDTRPSPDVSALTTAKLKKYMQITNNNFIFTSVINSIIKYMKCRLGWLIVRMTDSSGSKSEDIELSTPHQSHTSSVPYLCCVEYLETSSLTDYHRPSRVSLGDSLLMRCGGIDILPRLKTRDSAKRSSRLRVSSGVKYAFTSCFTGARPIITEDVVCSAYRPVTRAFPSSRAGRVDGTNPVRPATTGSSAWWVPPFASASWAGTWRSGSSELVPRGKSPQSDGTVEARGSQRGNACMSLIHTMFEERVGFIWWLQSSVFSVNLDNPSGSQSVGSQEVTA